MKYLLVKDLIEKLNEFDPNIPVVVTDEAKDHQYGIDGDKIIMIKFPYFGNDLDADNAFGNVDDCLNLVSF